MSFVVTSESTRSRNAEFSPELTKLYIDMNKLVEVRFTFGKLPTSGLFVRALPIFADANDIKVPVKRCPNHSQKEDPSNFNFTFLHHLIRFEEPSAMYFMI